MSAAFELLPPEPRRDKRLDFDFSAEENSERLANLVTQYGVGTHSYNSSAEKRELDRQRAEATARYKSQPKAEILLPLPCSCPQRSYTHDVGIHQFVRSESYNPRLKFRYPWSLCLSERVEPSTEKEGGNND